MNIRTERLLQFPLDKRQLASYLETPQALERELGYPLSRAVVTDRVQRAIRMKLAKMDRVTEMLHPWYTYWLLVVCGSYFGVGLAGFKGFPDAQGEAEIGYGIDPAFQGRGFITEAVRALIEWAFKEPSCLAVVARDTKKANLASNRVLEKVGMRVYEETGDAFYWKIERINDV